MSPDQADQLIEVVSMSQSTVECIFASLDNSQPLSVSLSKVVFEPQRQGQSENRAFDVFSDSFQLPFSMTVFKQSLQIQVIQVRRT